MFLYTVYYLEDWSFVGLFRADNSQDLVNHLPDWMNPLDLAWHVYKLYGA